MTKIRSGFVSNSSSASFVLKADITLPDFCQLLFPNFNKDSFRKILEDEMARLNKEIEDLRTSKSEFKTKMADLWISGYKVKINKYETMIKNLDNPSDIDAVKMYFDFKGYQLIDMFGKTVEVTGWMTMFNDDEDLGELFLDVEHDLRAHKVYFIREINEEG